MGWLETVFDTFHSLKVTWSIEKDLISKYLYHSNLVKYVHDQFKLVFPRKPCLVDRFSIPIDKIRYGVTWNEFVNLFVNSLTSYLRTFRGWEYHQSIRNEKLRFFWRSFIQKTRAQYLKGPLNEGLIRRRLRKPLHRTWRPGRPSPGGVVTRPGRQTQCKGFLNLHCFIRK